MTFEIIFVLGLLVLAVVLFGATKLSVDLVALMIMGVLLLSGIVTPEEGIAGFSNTATVTVGAMFVLSAGLYKTGVVSLLASKLRRSAKLPFWLLLTLVMVGVGAISAFINNTAAVAVFIPVVMGLAREAGVNPSKLLMPLSFASMFGGVCTLIGTSTNILVSSIAERYGQPPFSMFEFLPLGLIMFGAGTLYMLFIGVRLLPNRPEEKDLAASFDLADYLTELVLLPNSRSVGKKLRESPLLKEIAAEVLEIRREGHPLFLPSHDTVLEAGDTLRLRCSARMVKELVEREGVELKPHLDWKEGDFESEETTLVEAVIAPNTSLEGKSLGETRFRDVFGATALGLRQRGQILHENIFRTKLYAGDALLLEVHKDRLSELEQNRDFVVVSKVGLPEFRKDKILFALAIVAGVVVTASTGLLPIVVAAITGCILLVLSGCISPEEAYRSMEWKVIFLLAGVLTLGVAMEKSGAAQFLSTSLIGVLGPLGPYAIISIFYLLTSLLTEIMSNNATAALLAPIAIAAADSMGVNPMPLLMAVTFAASASFMTPIGYQTNTLIFGPGRFQFSDFLRVGTPLNVIFWILATFLIPYFWPL